MANDLHASPASTTSAREAAGFEPPTGITVAMPVYNDWACAALLLRNLSTAFAAAGRTARVVLIDDGSSELPPHAALAGPYPALSEIGILSLGRNLGHQRAIAIGLAYLYCEAPCAVVLVMDADGQDRPQDALRLLEELERHAGRKLIFAARTRRAESLLFRICYQSYRALHHALTGVQVRVGNFSAISFELLGRVVLVEDAWNHYAASVYKARIPHALLGAERAARLDGDSKMSFLALTLHGLSAISVFGEKAGVRVLLASAVAFTFGGAALAVAWLARAAGWIDFSTGFHYWSVPVCVLLGVALLLSAEITLLILNALCSPGFLALRDYVYFVRRYERIDKQAP
jgi:hypothetical protein